MPVITADRILDITTRVFRAAGWPEQDAAEVGRHFALANLSGHDSHGIGMLPLYMRSFADGWLKPSNSPADRIASGSFLVIDANLALGQPTARRAVARAADAAQECGVAVLNLLNAHHVGRIGDYAEQAADRGLVSLFWVNVAGRPPIVAAHGAREGRWGTNPHAVGLPARDGRHLILDFATSRMAHGKARVAMNKGVQASPGYLIDAEGRPTTDPSVVFPPLPMGALLPFGEHKGAGLAFVVEALSAALAGGALIKDAPARSWIINSMFAILIDPARLDTDTTARQARIDGIAAFLRAARPQDPANPVLAPGDAERSTRETRSREGVQIDDETWSQIVAAAKSVGVDA
ncbi:MAG: malate/lactate/ureidoglycolate dehydrogenase [Beijerinckiaceae bacterium]